MRNEISQLNVRHTSVAFCFSQLPVRLPDFFNTQEPFPEIGMSDQRPISKEIPISEEQVGLFVAAKDLNARRAKQSP